MIVDRLLILIFASGLLIALVAGCGGDTRRAESESTAAATTPASPPVGSLKTRAGPVIATKITDPARRAYVTKVDAICRRLDAERSAAQVRVGRAARTEEAARAYSETIAIGDRELRQIEAVPPPPGETALLRANVFDVVRQELKVRGQIGEALAAGDVPRLRVLRGGLDALTRSLGGFARGYGFRVCGED